MTTAVCAREGCENEFTKRVHNQRFCSRECCRIHTNARILAQYHQKKKRVMTGRVCKTKSCDTLLSRYNDDEFCAKCQQVKFEEKLKGWGWDLDDGAPMI